MGRPLRAHVGACAGGRMWQLQHRRRLLRVVWAARALKRRMSLRSGLALTEGRLLGDGSLRGVRGRCECTRGSCGGRGNCGLSWGGGRRREVGGELGALGGGRCVSRVGIVGFWGWGIVLVWVGNMREYMRLWKSCVVAGVIMLSIGSGNENVHQRGTSFGCGGCP